MPKVRVDRDVVDQAADELETCAQELRISHTVNGLWPADEWEAQEAYDTMCALVKKLRAALT